MDKKSNGLAVAGFVVAVVSCFLNMMEVYALGMIGGVVGTVLSYVAKTHIEESDVQNAKWIKIGITAGVISAVVGLSKMAMMLG